MKVHKNYNEQHITNDKNNNKNVAKQSTSDWAKETNSQRHFGGKLYVM